MADTNTSPVESARIEGVELHELRTFGDERGFFREAMKLSLPIFEPGVARLSHNRLQAGQPTGWQTLREGFSWSYVPQGTLRLALYDSRPDSATHGQFSQYRLGDEGLALIVRIPAGVAIAALAEEEANLVLATDRPAPQVEPVQVDFNW